MAKQTRQQRRREEREAKRGDHCAQTLPGDVSYSGERAAHLPTEAARWVEAFDLESPAQAREFHQILHREHGDGRLTEEQLSEHLASYRVALTVFRLRLAGCIVFGVNDPLDMAEVRTIYLPPSPEFAERLAAAKLPNGLTLVEMETLYRLDRAGA